MSGPSKALSTLLLFPSKFLSKSLCFELCIASSCTLCDFTGAVRRHMRTYIYMYIYIFTFIYSLLHPSLYLGNMTTWLRGLLSSVMHLRSCYALHSWLIHSWIFWLKGSSLSIFCSFRFCVRIPCTTHFLKDSRLRQNGKAQVSRWHQWGRGLERRRLGKGTVMGTWIIWAV